jgi:uncharacterized lipoprotein YmbA
MRIAAFLATLLLLACAGAAPTTTRYLLPVDAPPGSVRVEPAEKIGLGRIEVASYLEGSGLVIETESGQVRPARYHVWAEPLGDGLRRLLRAEISRALGSDVSADTTQQPRWDRTVDVGIERLHGDLSGTALLVARWRIVERNDPGDATTYRFSASEPLRRPGYAGLVDAEVALARQLAAAIARTLAAPR